ncbi:MAG: hypothetical protein KF897_06875 [Opitutaceae bacterium]|nr:hypothetical protein [Opitutaceae bacterium]
MKVTTENLNPACTVADAAFGRIDRGELSADELRALLANLAAVDPSQDQRHDPGIIVRVRDQSHLIRPARGQWLLYNARDVSQPGVKLALPELMAILEESAPSPAGAEPAPEAAPVPEASPRRNPRALVAVLLLAVGLGLNLWALAQWVLRERDPVPDCTPITDAAQLASLRRDLAGAYATGNEAGSRLLTIQASDRLELALLAADASGTLRPVRRLGYDFVWSRRRDGTICLVMDGRLQVVVGAEAATLQLSGDRYARLQSAGRR